MLLSSCNFRPIVAFKVSTNWRQKRILTGFDQLHQEEQDTVRTGTVFTEESAFQERETEKQSGASRHGRSYADVCWLVPECRWSQYIEKLQLSCLM